MDITPDDLRNLLYVLTDAGVRRARIGDDFIEVDFDAAVEEQPDVGFAPPPAKVVKSTEPAVEGARPGYSDLFGAHAPQFIKPRSE
jgi:hypothetical protein